MAKLTLRFLLGINNELPCIDPKQTGGEEILKHQAFHEEFCKSAYYWLIPKAWLTLSIRSRNLSCTAKIWYHIISMTKWYLLPYYLFLCWSQNDSYMRSCQAPGLRILLLSVWIEWCETGDHAEGTISLENRRLSHFPRNTSLESTSRTGNTELQSLTFGGNR